jgi:hypothetical protein
MQPETAPKELLREICLEPDGWGSEFALRPFLPTADAGRGNNLSVATSFVRTE